MTEREDFARVHDRYRTELLAHCYRMLGSIHDAEDLVQETYLRAWRSYETFEGRSSLRTWLYRIATNVCLTALEHRDRRLLPTGLGTPAAPETPLVPPTPEIGWLQPAPDALLGPRHGDPATIVATRSSFRLAMIAALQFLPARQRAVLILRDVLAMPAGEVADLLGTSVPAVKSALQRARGQLERLAPAEEEVRDSVASEQRELLDRYVTAFENTDIKLLLELLTDDAVAEMPPYPSWFAGREEVARFFAAQVLVEPGRYRLAPVRANGQPAFALYRRGDDGGHHPHSITVLTLAGGRISRISGFLDPGLFGPFGLAPTYAEQVAAAATT
ncbi:sigma-70 family RNA polymerase sigma factor [Kitasatospora sp. NBC_00315]|uniref:sigma-70 family RNA polymerase sigma factor n=1 Tax=Kitasatospora sp. NBC_00315 TaxID=2975963 RepID=UPI003251405A